jgi:SAM-dependent MidA family methyltransferase
VSSDLVERIGGEIRRRGPIPFARFMELALYDAAGGYYARGGRVLGTGGDFFTASDVGRLFGASIARQLVEIDRRIGPLDPFHVIEFGSGRGLLARDVLDSMADLDTCLASRLRYVLVDRSQAMLEESRRLVPEGHSVEPADLSGGLTGCVLAVELFDALPVHRVRRRGGRLVELSVGLDGDGALVELEGPCSPEVQSIAERYAAAAGEGTEAEVATDADAQLETMAASLDLGVMLIVDYGERANALYDASRPLGTLLAYHRQTTNRSYLERVGRQDLTAHVNFSALEDRAVALGLRVLGLTTQDRFLIGNGILDAFRPDDPARLHDPQRVKLRLQAMQLIHPSGMGRRFKVLALAKGCEPVLTGLRDPF